MVTASPARKRELLMEQKKQRKIQRAREAKDVKAKAYAKKVFAEKERVRAKKKKDEAKKTSKIAKKKKAPKKKTNTATKIKKARTRTQKVLRIFS